MPLPKRKYHKRGSAIDGFKAVDHPLYRTWVNMMRRCYREQEPSYMNYGGRGIIVCEEWWHFANFVRDMGPKSSRSDTLDRIDNDKGYSKDNCRWTTRTEQCLNRRIFKTNRTGCSGVLPLKNGTFLARYDFEGVRYQIGRFVTLEAAVEARVKFVELFNTDRGAAVAFATSERVSLKSSTGVRGVTKHKDGGYIVRTTRNGIREYVGYYKTFEEAVDAKQGTDRS